MFIDCWMVIVYGVTGLPGMQFQYQNRKIHWIIEQSTESNKSTELNKRRQNEEKLNNKTGNKQHRHWMVVWFTKRLNRDRPVLARGKYLCDYKIDNCNPLLSVCYFMRNQMLCCRILCFSRRHTCSWSRRRPQKVDTRMVLEHTHGLFIT